MRTYIVLIIIFIMLLVLAGIVGSYEAKCFDYQVYIALRDRHIAEQQVALDRIPTIKQLQKMVGAEPDGVIGPNTIKLWEKAINNQEYKKMIERMSNE